MGKLADSRENLEPMGRIWEGGPDNETRTWKRTVSELEYPTRNQKSGKKGSSLSVDDDV